MSINLTGVSLSYDHKQVTDNLNIEFTKGQITTLLGANGSGKSTILKSIVKFITPDNGRLTIDHLELATYSRLELATKISFLSQINSKIDDMTVFDIVKQGLFKEMNIFGKLSASHEQKVTEILAFTGLTDYARVPLSELSGGEVQRVWISLTLVQDSEYIILDEPTNHLDIKYAIEILKIIHDYNRTYQKTIILVLHDINLASRFSDQIILLKNGAIIDHGECQSVLTKENIDNVYNVDSYVYPCPIYNNPRVIIK